MSTPVSFNGSTYAIPAVGERRWGQAVSNFLIALGNNALSKAGGNFILSADVNFGPTYGLVAKYLKSGSTNIAQSGVIRFANNEGLAWRNAANNADILLKVNASNQLEVGGVALATATDNNLKLDKTSGIASQLNVGDYVDYDHETTPSAPAAGKIRVYGKADNKLYQQTPAGIESVLGGGGLAGRLASANITANVGDMIEGTSTGGFVVTLPPIPAGGGSIGVMDAGETCSATNYIRVTPASGQSIDGYPANDSLDLDYVRANVILYAAPGATSWKVQYQSTSMIQPGFQTGKTDGVAIGAGFIGEKITWTTPPGTLVLGTSEADWTNAFLTLTPGVWQIYASIVATYVTGTTANNAGYASVKITDSSNVIVQEMDKNLYVITPAANSNQIITSIPLSFVANVSVSTVYKIRASRTDLSGTGSGQLRNGSTERSHFFAVRIA